MSDHEDDLSAFSDDPIVRALTGPGTPDELAGEAEALAGFRAAVPGRSRRRLIGRLGVGGSALGIAVALSGGVAAAYTASWPTPIQQAFHDATTWLGAIKVPAPHPPKPVVVAHATGLPSSSPVATEPVVPTPTLTPAARRTHGTAAATRHRVNGSTKRPRPTPTPTVTPTPIATATTSPSPTPSPVPTSTVTSTPGPGSITISLSDTTVAPGGTVTAYGRLATSEGQPVSGEQVWLMERTPGQPGVSQVDSGTTGDDGSVSLQTPALTNTVRLRLVTDAKASSAWITVILRPTVSATVTTNGTSSSIQISTDGAHPGDMVDIQRHVAGGWQDVAANQLDSSGSATFGVPTPPRRPDHYRAVLPRTQAHGYAATRFEVPPA